MNNNKFDCSRLESMQYESFSGFPQAMALIELEFLHTSAQTTDYHRGSTKGIAFALGFAGILILLSGFQLYRSVKVSPTSSTVIESQVLSTSDAK